MKLLTSLSVLGLVLTTTSQTYALSCASTGFDLETNFKSNKAAGNKVVYVLGSFSGKQSAQIKKNKSVKTGTNGISLVRQQPKATVSNLSFSGKIMTKNGAKPFKQKVKVTTTCIASWCGKIPKSGQKTIAALTKTASGYTITAGACGPNTFSNQIKKDWQKLKRLVR